MKKILTSLLIVMACVTLVGCDNKEKETKKDNAQSIENVSMIIKEGTLTRTSATIIITDTNENHYFYGEPYRIDKKINENWKELKMADNGFNYPAYHVDENNQLEMDLNWSYMYGELEDGEYRIVKDVCVSNGCKETKDFYAEFTINEDIIKP